MKYYCNIVAVVMVKRRNTMARQAVLNMLQNSGAALSQDMIELRLQGVADRVTIYRVLNSFCTDGIAHRIVSDEGKAYFAFCTSCSDHHHHDHFHFRCLSCQRVECLPGEINIAVPGGYRTTNVNCCISGYCKRCGSL